VIGLAPSCYGKLPLHGDFIKINAGGPELGWLDGWLGEGLVRAGDQHGESWAAAFDAAPALRFVRNLDGKTFLTGVLACSQDRVGRRFPCAIYWAVNDRYARKHPAALPLLLSDSLDRAETLLTSGSAGLDLDGFRNELAELASAGDPKAAQGQLDALIKQSSSSALWEGLEPAAASLLLHNAVGLLAPAASPTFALGFPAPPSTGLAAFWLHAAAELRGRAGFPPLAIWSSAGLRMILREPTAAHFVASVLPSLDADGTCQLASEGLELDSLRSKAEARFGAVVQRGGTLKDLLAALRKG